MPELPEVETVRIGLEKVLVGRKLAKVQIMRPNLRFPFPHGFQDALKNKRVIRLYRRGKFLLVDIDSSQTLVVHLGMSGRFKIYLSNPPDIEPHDHVLFEIEGGVNVRFNDPRRFGFMDLLETNKLADSNFLKNLGPEPLENDFNGPELVKRLRSRRSPIKTVLLDQSVVAGLGNIYVSEALFRAGLSPKRLAANILGSRAEALVLAIRNVLADAIAAGGSSLRDHRQPTGEIGYFQHYFSVYGRTGKACPECICDIEKTGGIKRINQSGRSTFYCARKQR
mgnify:CR=1 FL=1